MDVETTRYTYHVFKELLIWVHYLDRALQKMYELAGDKCDRVVELTALNNDLKSKSDASVAEIDEHMDEIASCRAQIAGYVTRIKQLEDQAAGAMSEHTRRLSEADARYRTLECEKAASDQNYLEEINRLKSELAARTPITPATNITRSIDFDRNTSRGGRSNDSEDRLASLTGTPMRSRVGPSSYSEGESKARDPSFIVLLTRQNTSKDAV